MAGKADSKLKTLRLMDILTEHTDEDHPMPANEICERLVADGIAAERKSIYKNIDVLNDYGLDIVKVTTPKKGYFLGERDFQEVEAKLMADAIQSASFISAKKSNELVEKIQSCFSVYQRATLNNTVFIDKSKKTTNEQIYIFIDAINRAISHNKMVEITYKKREIIAGKPNDATRILVVSPYATMWFADHYYLICNHKDHDNFMHLRIERIIKVREREEDRKPLKKIYPPYSNGFDTADYASKIFEGFSGEIQTVTLRCAPELYETIYDHFGDNLRVVKIYEDNSFIARVDVAVSKGFEDWLLKFGTGIKVEEPGTLADRVKKRATEITDMYE
ncbi:MAG: WYL domain-containing protein [Clostridia bacterium]|nr:WYL domain-containing protein [Clostridia bacterium]